MTCYINNFDSVINLRDNCNMQLGALKLLKSKK